MDPRQYLVIAAELGACTPVEYRRSAINRAYYGAFGVAHQSLRSVDCPIPQSGWGHTVVQLVLQRAGDASLQQAGNLLRQLYTLRTKADYHYDNTLPEERRTANDAVRLAGYIVQRLDAAMGRPDDVRAATYAAFAAMLVDPLVAIGRVIGVG